VWWGVLRRRQLGEGGGERDTKQHTHALSLSPPPTHSHVHILFFLCSSPVSCARVFVSVCTCVCLSLCTYTRHCMHQFSRTIPHICETFLFRHISSSTHDYTSIPAYSIPAYSIPAYGISYRHGISRLHIAYTLRCMDLDWM
jgi:hypothetical protein